jgi:hypothetical protein
MQPCRRPWGNREGAAHCAAPSPCAPLMHGESPRCLCHGNGKLPSRPSRIWDSTRATEIGSESKRGVTDLERPIVPRMSRIWEVRTSRKWDVMGFARRFVERRKAVGLDCWRWWSPAGSEGGRGGFVASGRGGRLGSCDDVTPYATLSARAEFRACLRGGQPPHARCSRRS